MNEADKLNKEVGSLASSIRARLVNPAETLENRVSEVEQKVLLLNRICILLSAFTTLSLGGIVYILTR
ncbi:hypothetical protein [Desulfocucumis palustris]|nr:hypothetical protein [Desulfocucumis palustris]